VKIASQSHVTDAEIERVLSGNPEASEVRRLVAHLARCPVCFRRERPRLAWLSAVLSGAEAAPEPLDAQTEAAYDEALDRALAAAERQIPWWRAEGEWRRRLLAAERDRTTYRLDGNHLLWPGDEDLEAPGGAVLEALLTLSHEMRYRDPEAMYDLALAAVHVSHRLGQREQDLGRYTAVQVAEPPESAQAAVAGGEDLRGPSQAPPRRRHPLGGPRRVPRPWPAL
jgi:hypothetical protein